MHDLRAMQPKGCDMSNSSDDYGKAFERWVRARTIEDARHQAEFEADKAKLDEVLLSELEEAKRQLKQYGGKVDTPPRAEGGGIAPVVFCIKDRDGRHGMIYSITLRDGMVSVTCSWKFDETGRQPYKPQDISEKVGIQRRQDITVENVKKLILRAIDDYGSELRDSPGLGAERVQ